MNASFGRRIGACAFVTLVVALALQACGEGGGSSNPGAAGGIAAGDVPVQFVVDAGSSADSTAAAEVDSAGPGDAVQPSDASVDAVGPNCPGSAGCPCTDAADCDTGLCLESPEGKRCAAPCVDSCGPGQRCAAIPQGSDVLQACVSAWARLCSPCSASADCNHPGVTDARCVDRGDAGAFCGVGCATDDDCPADAACKKAFDVEGNATNQCVPVDGNGALGSCTCSANAAALALVGSCKQAVVSPQGELVCSGALQCKQAGAAASCDAAAPAPEACNGKDDDCDGQTDNDLCDDGDPCTTDACDAGQGACTHAPLAQGSACDADGNPCTVGDSCEGGSCVAGPLKSCDDGNPCTADACDLAGACTQTHDDGAPCSDDNPCTLGDVCNGGSCSAGTAKSCPTPDTCTIAKCSLTDGKCKFAETDDGVPCDDDNPCTEADACKLGLCKGKGVVCDDGNACTTESCTLAAGCVSKPLGVGVCDDGDACTSGEACAAGLCAGATVTDCDDGNACTVDSCDKAKGCAHAAASGGPCDDGDACTKGDSCQAGGCAPGSSVCACKTDADCKDDGNLCNGTPVCAAQGNGLACKIDPASIVSCDTNADGACKQTACVAATGKCAQSAKADGAPCEDGSLCTAGDACAAGSCAPGKAVDCDDNNPCTADSCDPAKGCVQAAKDGAPCDADGSACTAGDACAGSVCTPGAKLLCDDDNPCTLDSCDPAKGCVAASITGGCDDGDACTAGDACEAGSCKPGASICACKTDADCKDDGDLCNGTPVCAAQGAGLACKVDPATIVSCDTSTDGACKQTACVAATGKCAQSAKADATSCDDGDACTAGDACAAGSCAPGKAVDCDDGNLCTADSCDKAKGCANLVQLGLSQPCYGGPAGTAGVGICQAGKQSCDANGQLGACQGAVLPAQSESCNGKDDDCDGQIDQGCKPAGATLSAAPLRVWAKGKSLGLDGAMQTGPSGSATGNGKTLRWSLVELWRGWFQSN